MKINIRDQRVYSTLIMLLLLALLPFVAGSYNRHLVVLSFIWASVAICWNLLLGYSGISSFGNLVFFAIGGYSSAWLALNIKLSPWIGILVGGVFALGMSLLIGFLTLRLRGIYTALFTFAFQEMLRYIFLLPESTWFSGGPIGLMSVPGFLVGSFKSGFIDYYLGLAVLILTTLAIYKTLNSKIGLALTAMGQSEVYARTLGTNVFKYRLLAFMISAFLTGVAGSFYAHYLGVMTDEALSFLLLVSIIFMILIGGSGTLYGPIVGAFIYTFMSEYLKGVIAGAFRPIFIGVTAIVILIFFPYGLLEALRKLFLSVMGSKPSEHKG